MYTIIKVFDFEMIAINLFSFYLCKFFSIILIDQVARDDDLVTQIGKDIFFDLVDHDKVKSFRIQKQTPFVNFKVDTWHCFSLQLPILNHSLVVEFFLHIIFGKTIMSFNLPTGFVSIISKIIKLALKEKFKLLI